MRRHRLPAADPARRRLHHAPAPVRRPGRHALRAAGDGRPRRPLTRGRPSRPRGDRGPGVRAAGRRSTEDHVSVWRSAPRNAPRLGQAGRHGDAGMGFRSARAPGYGAWMMPAEDSSLIGRRRSRADRPAPRACARRSVRGGPARVDGLAVDVIGAGGDAEPPREGWGTDGKKARTARWASAISSRGRSTGAHGMRASPSTPRASSTFAKRDGHPFADDLVQLACVPSAQVRRGEPRVMGQLGPTHHARGASTRAAGRRRSARRDSGRRSRTPAGPAADCRAPRPR